MARKVKLTIRFKLLSLLILLILGSLGTYLFFALDMFTKDKQAYIFQNGLASTESLGQQVSNFINYSSKNSFSLAMMSKTDRAQVQKLMDIDKSFITFSVLTRSNDTLNEKIRFVNRSFKKQYELEQSSQVDLNKIKIFKSEHLSKDAFTVFNTTKVLNTPSLGLVLFNAKTNEFYASILALDQLIGIFTDVNNIYSNILLSFDAQVYIKSKESDASEEYISKILANNLTSGTQEIKSSSGKSKLVAFNKIKDIKMVIFSEISKEKAFQATQLLVEKSIYFGLILVGIACFMGVLVSTSITAPIKALFQGTVEMAAGNFDKKINIKAQDELGVLSDSFNFMSDKISGLLKETAQKARMEKELETAKTVQETLFPPLSSKFENMNIAGFYTPASECGGDWWYYSDVGDKIFLWIGDVTGHGVPAALITSAACSAASIIENITGISPEKALDLLNNAIYHTSKGKMHMTFFLSIFDKKSYELKYANASHNAPFLYKFNNESLKIKDLIPLDGSSGPRLGQASNSKYKLAKMQLEKDDTILFYTDGVTELENEKGEQWGERKFLKSVINASKNNDTCDKVIKEIQEAIENYRNKTELQDDITFFISRLN